jgi:peptidoglycan/LPS O-acetylase OafA/YrhL
VKHNNFNLLRLIAAAQVVYIHTYGHLGMTVPSWLANVLGQFPGVPMFFIISGFLVTESFMRSGVGTFFAKRALRIYPALIVNIVILDVSTAIGGGLVVVSWAWYLAFYLPLYSLTASSLIASEIAQTLSGLPGGVAAYLPAFYDFYPSGVLWTLTVELSFYLVLPIFLIVAKRSRSVGAVDCVWDDRIVSVGSIIQCAI